MKVATHIKRSDLIWLNISLLPRLKSTYTTMIFIATMVFAYIWWKNGFPDCSREWFIAIFASLGGAVGGILFGFVFQLVCILFMSKESNGILGKHEYEINSEGLYEKTNANEGIQKWQGVSSVRKTNSFILLQVSGYLFHVFPKRCFDSLDHFQEFYEQSKQYFETVHQR